MLDSDNVEPMTSEKNVYCPHNIKLSTYIVMSYDFSPPT